MIGLLANRSGSLFFLSYRHRGSCPQKYGIARLKVYSEELKAHSGSSSRMQSSKDFVYHSIPTSMKMSTLMQRRSIFRSRTRSSSCGIPPFNLLGDLKWILRPSSAKSRVFAFSWIAYNIDVSWS